MPPRPEQIAAARDAQERAAHSEAPATRTVAGPGTGKSRSIRERVRWLIQEQGVAPNDIWCVSFTRAAAQDLDDRVNSYLAALDPDLSVRATTLHSLAATTLRRAGVLGSAFATDPLFLDGWEQREIFDEEFGDASVGSATRAKAVRVFHEGIWSTGVPDHPRYEPADPPVSEAEISLFTAFHSQRRQFYSCVLPGELIRFCVEELEAGVLDLHKVSPIKQLIVDEFQDLNPMDLKLIGHFAASDCGVWVAGDDDQSIYGFRYASPDGIQTFLSRFSGSESYELSLCFRTTPTIFSAAYSLLIANPDPQRIPKNSAPVYAAADPIVPGQMHLWHFDNDWLEADAIAETCVNLIATGLPPGEIMILLSDRSALGWRITRALSRAEVPFTGPRDDGWKDTDEGRLLLAILRLVSSEADLVAARTILGLCKGIGAAACNAIVSACISASCRFAEAIENPNRVQGQVPPRAIDALDLVREVCALSGSWTVDDLLGDRKDALVTLAEHVLQRTPTTWDEALAPIPDSCRLRDLREYLWAEEERQPAVLRRIHASAGLPEEEQPQELHAIRLSSMHAAKGLEAAVVFVPGLEDEIFPGDRASANPGLVLERARALYVALTRARVGCFVTYADERFFHGEATRHRRSMFATQFGAPFLPRTAGLPHGDAASLVLQWQNL